MRTVVDADDGVRLDRWFRLHYPQVKHGQLQKMLRKGQVKVDGRRVQADTRVLSGEEIRVPPVQEIDPGAVKLVPRLSRDDVEFMRSLILFEDKDILALNKPAGLAVQGGVGQIRHIDGMLGAFEKNGDRPRLVHRLDRDTGGLLLLGKTRASAAYLAEAFRQHRITKTYWALTRGVPHPMSGRIDLAIDKSGGEGAERMRPGPTGKRAITDYQVVDAAGTKAAFVALRPTTGRTHQLRVHLSTIGTPIVGDRKYGGERAMLDGVPPQMHLFCREMTVPLAHTWPLTLTAPLTQPMDKTWEFFGFDSPDNLDWPE